VLENGLLKIHKIGIKMGVSRRTDGISLLYSAAQRQDEEVNIVGNKLRDLNQALVL
jgi:hypothetical protein